MSTTAGRLNPRQPLFVNCKGESSFEGHLKGSIRIKPPPLSDDEDADCTSADDQSASRDYQKYNNSFVCVKSCPLSDENADAESSRMTPETNDDSTMNPIKEDPDAPAAPTTSTQDIKLPEEDEDIDDMCLFKRMLVPLHPSGRPKRVIIKKVKLLPEKPPPKRPKPQKTKLSKAPCVTKTRRILPKLMPILTVMEGDGTQVEEPAPEAEDPLKEENLVTEDLNAMDKMLDDLRNTCPVCSMRFNSALQMGKHFRQRHEHQFRCRNCRFRCSTLEDLTDHMRTHDQDTFLQCELCDRKYKRMRGLMAHWIQKHTTEDPESMLDMLPKQSAPAPSKADVENTWDRRELLRRTYSCQICKNAYPRKSLLIAHERIAHGIGTEDKRYHCDACNKTFKNRHQLYNHKKSYHKARVTNRIRHLLPKQTQNWDGQCQYGC